VPNQWTLTGQVTRRNEGVVYWTLALKRPIAYLKDTHHLTQCLVFSINWQLIIAMDDMLLASGLIFLHLWRHR
jgi:hypothetical protein